MAGQRGTAEDDGGTAEDDDVERAAERLASRVTTWQAYSDQAEGRKKGSSCIACCGVVVAQEELVLVLMGLSAFALLVDGRGLFGTMRINDRGKMTV